MLVWTGLLCYTIATLVWQYYVKMSRWPLRTIYARFECVKTIYTSIIVAMPLFLKIVTLFLFHFFSI